MSPPPRPAPVCRGSAPAQLREDTGHEDVNAREPGLPHSDAEGRSHAKSSHHIVFQKLTRLDDRHHSFALFLFRKNQCSSLPVLTSNVRMLRFLGFDIFSDREYIL